MQTKNLNNIVEFPANSLNRAVELLAKKVADVESYNILVRQVAHDIQSPLTSLKVAVSHLQTQDDKTKRIIMDAIERIQSISLELSTTSTTNSTGCVNLTETARVVTHQKTFEYMNKNIQYIFKSGEDVIMKNINKDVFSRMLSNLINNSIESFENNEGTIEIDIKDFKNYFVISIKDNGKGIPADVQTHVGQRGFTFGKQEGQGLGLSYVKETVEKMGGQVNVISKENKGTLVQIVVPN